MLFLEFHSEDTPGANVDFIPVADPMSYNPNNLASGSNNGHFLLIGQRHFNVDQKIADLFRLLHTQRCEIVALDPHPPFHRKLNFIQINLRYY